MIQAFFSCSRKEDVPQTLSIVPEPHHIEMEDGSFEIDRDTRIVVDTHEEDMQRIAESINERFRKAAGYDLEVTSEMTMDHAIFFMNAGMPHESYSIHVEPNRVVVDYGDPAGAFYAVQTILQMLPPEIFAESKQPGIDLSIPCCRIADEPRFKYRGMHIDCSLHFFDIDFLKRYIDLMAMHKVNVFHWHLTDDQGWRLEIKKYPLLTEKGQWRKETVIGSLRSGVYDGQKYGGYYTQDEVR